MKKMLFSMTVLLCSPLSAQQAASPVQTAPASAGPAATTTAAAPATQPTPLQRPAATSTEVASIVAKEFPAYDKDASGALSQNEFGEWMVRLKTIADPNTRPDAPATKTWVNAAFAQADADRSRSLTLGELTGFLALGRS